MMFDISKMLLFTAVALFTQSSCSTDEADVYYSVPVSSINNPPIASLSEVLTAPVETVTVFETLRSITSTRSNTNWSTDDNDSEDKISSDASDESMAQWSKIGVHGGFSGITLDYPNGDDFLESNTDVSDSADGRFRTFAENNVFKLHVLIPGSGYSELDYTDMVVVSSEYIDRLCISVYSCFGSGDLFRDVNAYTFGLITASTNMPQTGQATFTGVVAGSFDPFSFYVGDAFVQVDFDTGEISGMLTNMTDNNLSLPDIELNAAFSILNNQVTGNAWDTAVGYNENNNELKMRFFGPNAEEIGGVIGILINGRAMAMSIAARR